MLHNGSRIRMIAHHILHLRSSPVVLAVLGFILTANLLFLWLSSSTPQSRDGRRARRAIHVLSIALEPYEAVLSHRSHLPPRGSPVHGRISSPFGMRIHPKTRHPRFHYGVDLAVPVGSDVMVTADGWVSRVDVDPDGWGLFVDIVHPGSGYLTRYAHLSHVVVKQGQPVQRGRIIALSGDSGNSVGAHLHYEVRTRDGKALDPLTLMH